MYAVPRFEADGVIATTARGGAETRQDVGYGVIVVNLAASLPWMVFLRTRSHSVWWHAPYPCASPVSRPGSLPSRRPRSADGLRTASTEGESWLLAVVCVWDANIRQRQCGSTVIAADVKLSCWRFASW